VMNRHGAVVCSPRIDAPSEPRESVMADAWRDELAEEPWRERRAHRQRMVAVAVIAALALPGAFALLSLLI